MIFGQKRCFSNSTLVQAIKKKIEVQLLKDFEGVGKRGEIIKVLPSRMINQLHPNNGAVYILPGQPPRIPVVERAVTTAFVPLSTTVKSEPIVKVETESTTIKSPSGQVLSDTSTTSIFDSLGGLSFDFEQPKEATNAEENTESAEDLAEKQAKQATYYKYDSLKELPSVLRYTRPAQKTGVLGAPITTRDFANILKISTGYSFEDHEISFFYTGSEKDDGRISVSKIDFVGPYEVVIKVGSQKPHHQKVFITSKNLKDGKFPIRPAVV